MALSLEQLVKHDPWGRPMVRWMESGGGGGGVFVVRCPGAARNFGGSMEYRWLLSLGDFPDVSHAVICSACPGSAVIYGGVGTFSWTCDNFCEVQDIWKGAVGGVPVHERSVIAQECVVGDAWRKPLWSILSSVKSAGMPRLSIFVAPVDAPSWDLRHNIPKRPKSMERVAWARWARDFICFKTLNGVFWVMAGWNNVLMFMIFCFGSNPYDAYFGGGRSTTKHFRGPGDKEKKKMAPLQMLKGMARIDQRRFQSIGYSWFVLRWAFFSLGTLVCVDFWVLSALCYWPPSFCCYLMLFELLPFPKIVRAADLFSRARLIQNRLSHLADGEYDPPRHPTLAFLFLGEVSTWNSSVCRDIKYTKCIKLSYHIMSKLYSNPFYFPLVPGCSRRSCKRLTCFAFAKHMVITPVITPPWEALPIPAHLRTSMATSSDPVAFVRAPRPPWPWRWKRCDAMTSVQWGKERRNFPIFCHSS